MANPSALVALIALLALTSAQVINIGQTYNIIGSGTTTYTKLGNSLSFAYRAVDTTALAIYFGTSSGNGATTGIAQTSDYTVMNQYFTIAQMNPIYNLPQYWTFMGASSGATVGYTVPDYPMCGSPQAAGGGPCGQLAMDRLTYLLMNMQNVTMWGDARITTLNPNVAVLANLANTRMNYEFRNGDACGDDIPMFFVIHGAASQYQIIFAMPISNKPSVWPYVYLSGGGTSTSIPVSFLGTSTVNVVSVTSYPPCNSNTFITINSQTFAQCNWTFFTAGSSGAQSITMLRPYTWGWVSFVFILDLHVPFFTFTNKFGATGIIPSAASMQAAIQYGTTVNDPISAAAVSYLTSTASLSTQPMYVAGNSLQIGSTAGMADSKSPTGWPFTEWQLMATFQVLHTDCFRALTVAQFLVWSIQSPFAQIGIATFGYGIALVPGQYGLNTIAALTCGLKGQFNVYDTVYPYETGLGIFAVVLAALTWALGIVVVVIRHHPAIVRAGRWVLLGACATSGLNYFTVYLWLGFPTQPICQARPWVTSISFMVIFGYIMYQYQDRIFVTVDIPALLEESATDEAGLQAAKAVREQEEKERAQEMASSQSSASGSSDQADEATKAFRANLVRIGLIVLLVCCNIIIPLIWMTTSPQSAMYRQCAGNYEETWRQLMIFYNLILVALCSLTALQIGDKGEDASNPIHVMVVIICLFVPLQFLYSEPNLNAITDRSLEGIILSPTVAIIVTTFCSSLLVLLPPMIKAFTQTPEETIAQLTVDQETRNYRRKRRTTHSTGHHAPTPATIKVVDA